MAPDSKSEALVNDDHDETIGKLASLEARVTGLEEKARETTSTLTKLIWALLGLIAALVGKESAVAALGGHTPMQAYVNFFLVCFIIGGLVFWAASDVFLSKRCNILPMLAAVAFFIMAGVRINLGLHDVTTRGMAVTALALLVGAMLILSEELLLWLENRWWSGSSPQGKSVSAWRSWRRPADVNPF